MKFVAETTSRRNSLTNNFIITNITVKKEMLRSNGSKKKVNEQITFSLSKEKTQKQSKTVVSYF